MDVAIPALPPPESQSLAAWLASCHAQVPGPLAEQDILIGHSSGALLALRLLEQNKTPARAVFLICPFIAALHNEYDKYNASFFAAPFDWPRLRAIAQTRAVFAGDDDPYVPLSYSKTVAEKLTASCTVIQGGGHLNSAAGYREFPQLLQAVRAVA